MGNQWLSANAKWLFVVWAATGSSFTAVHLACSGSFQLALFQLPLSKKQLNKFSNKAIYSTVLLRNIPQLCIQCYVIWMDWQDVNDIVLASMLFSALSIFAAYLTHSERKIHYRTGFLKIEFEVHGHIDDKCKTRIIGIKRGIAEILDISPTFVEVLPPSVVSSGQVLKVNVNVHVSLTKSIDIAHKVDRIRWNPDVIVDMIQSAWHLSDVPMIAGFEARRIISENRRHHQVDINLRSLGEDQVGTELDMLSAQVIDGPTPGGVPGVVGRTNDGLDDDESESSDLGGATAKGFGSSVESNCKGGTDGSFEVEDSVQNEHDAGNTVGTSVQARAKMWKSRQ